MTDTLREAFEAWANTQCLDTTVYRGKYLNDTGLAWDAWQAGAQAERERAAKICEDLAAPEYLTGHAVSIFDAATLDCAEAIVRGHRE